MIGRAVIVLERVELGHESPYCTHGYTTCVACDEWVGLGDRSVEAVLSGQCDALCRPCATELLPAAGGVFVGNIGDHQRVDGPHE